jgi:tripartite-type tricarboxylate transporter receptor subunit TctC
MKRTFISFAAAATAVALAAPATAQSAADVFKDRTVTILVGYGAGGTYGQTALLLSNHLGNHIPGKPNVIVQHMPGAGGLKAANYAYVVMPKNGHNILMPPEMSVVSQMLRPKRVRYDVAKMHWLGTVFGANQIMMVRRDTGIKGIEDLRKKEVIVASTGTGSPTYIVPAMMNGILKTKFKIVTGYKGSAGTSLSVEQGETFVDQKVYTWTDKVYITIVAPDHNFDSKKDGLENNERQSKTKNYKEKVETRQKKSKSNVEEKGQDKIKSK